MMRFIQKACSFLLLPLCSTLLTIFLLCLPGSAIPNTGVFSIAGIDKVVHVCLFGFITLSWGFYFVQYEPLTNKRLWILLAIAAATILLGVVLEYVQRDYIPNRSFDRWDIVADSAGALLAFSIHLVARRQLKIRQ